MASNARNLSKLLGTSTQVPTTALPPAIADLETVGQTLSGGEITPSSIKSNTLTQSFDSNQAVTFNMADSIDAVSPIVSVFKEVPQPGVSSKGKWDVNANATNYDFYDEKPISYSSSTLTPSATGDGTFTNSSAIVTPYMLSNLSYDSKSFDASTQLGNAEGIAFKSDGTAMYLIGFSNDKVWQYTLSTAYDISTASYSNKSFSVASQDGVPRDVRFKPDGTIMYVIASTAPDSVYQYTLSTAWDISTASYANKSLSVQSQSINPAGLVLSPDGTKVYVAGHSNKNVFQYNLSTAWDVSTGTYSNNFIDLSSGVFTASNPSLNALEVNADASKLFVATHYEIAEYNMPSDGNVSNASYVAIHDVTDTTVGTKNIGGMTFANSGAKFYIFGNNDMHAYQFSSTASLAFNSSDVGKKVVGNSGSAIITATSGTYESVTPFADTSAISSWQLYGTEGKSDGTGIELSGIAVSDVYNLSAASYDNKSFDTSSQLSGASDYEGIAFKDDGTAMYLIGFTNDTVYQYTLTTAWDVSTASYSNKSFSVATQDGVPRDIRFKSDGTSFYVIASTAPDSIYQYNLTTAWDVSTASYSNKSFSVQTQTDNPSGLAVSADGTKFYVCHYGSTTSYQYDLTTAWDISTASYSNKSFTSTSGQAQQECIDISSDGLKFFVCGTLDDAVLQYDLSTAWDITTASTTHSASLSPADVGLNGVLTNGWYQFVFSATGHKLYSFGNSKIVYQISASNEVYTHPYSQYLPALTNSSTGQINSSSWLDINSMTADETKNDGDIFYAVSTDNRTSWGVAKGSDGVRKIAKNNSGTWQYNNNAGTSVTTYYDISNASDQNKTFTQSAEYHGGFTFNDNGTKFYVAESNYITASYNRVREYNLSTAYDISTTSGIVNTFFTNIINLWSIQFNDDGTKFYAMFLGGSACQVKEYDLTTAYDLSTLNTTPAASLTITGPDGSGSAGYYRSFLWSSDGTKAYIIARESKIVRQWEFTTAYDVSTGSYNSNYFDASTQVGTLNLNGIAFNANGTKMIIVKQEGGANDGLIEYNLSTAWDITTASYSNVTKTIAPNNNPTSLGFNGDGSKVYIGMAGSPGIVKTWSSSGTDISFSTSETWVNGTNNNEHATLQQALTSQAFNRMNKAQLDAIADANHFSQDSADTLDLMIAPYAASGSSPISDGVTINYDAEALIREAIPGTDYIAEFPNPTTLNITAVGAANLKIRAQ